MLTKEITILKSNAYTYITGHYRKSVLFIKDSSSLSSLLVRVSCVLTSSDIRLLVDGEVTDSTFACPVTCVIISDL